MSPWQHRTIAVLVLLAGQAAFAQPNDTSASSESGTDEHTAEALRSNAEPFQFNFAPFVWAASLSGDAGVGRHTADVNVTFWDMISGSDTLYGLQGNLELGRGRWSVFFDTNWVHAEADAQSGSIGASHLDLAAEIDMAIFEVGGTWNLAGGMLDAPVRTWHIDAIGGARVDAISVDLEASLDTPGTVLGGEPRSRDRSETWIEPFIGARLGFDLGEDWRIQLRGDVGGFGAGSDFAWQAVGLVGYDFRLGGTASTVFFGYRALGQDYEEGSGTDRFEWDAIIHGPMLGLNFSF